MECCRLASVACAMLLIASVSSAPRAENPPGPPPGAGPPASNNASVAPAAVPGQPPAVANCKEPSGPRATGLEPVTITVNPATRWQPRGGEVIVAVKGDPAAFRSLVVRACFGWSTASAEKYFTRENFANFYDAFVHFRPSDTAGIINLVCRL
jgi:hypothetical protein